MKIETDAVLVVSRETGAYGPMVLRWGDSILLCERRRQGIKARRQTPIV